MTFSGFLVQLLAWVCGIAGTAVAVNVGIDMYGLFRPSHTDGLKVYGEERVCKYLFSYRHIPANYDGLLLGSSATDNIPLRQAAGCKIYNASLNGGNMTEAKDLGVNALRRGRFKLLVLGINRYLMQDAGHKTNFMTPERYWGALGSMQLYTAYLGRALDLAGVRPTAYDSSGALQYGTTPPVRDEVEQFAARLRRGEKTNWIFAVDPRALRDLKDLVDEAHRRGIRLVVFYPPLPTAIQEAIAPDWKEFRETLRPAFGPEDAVVDFNRAEYRGLTDDYANYRDHSHLSDRGAARFSIELERAVTAALH